MRRMLFQKPTQFHMFLYVENITYGASYRQKWGQPKTHLRPPAANGASCSILTVEFPECLGAEQAGEVAGVVVEVGEDWGEVLNA
jgi:hypothetical protein